MVGPPKQAPRLRLGRQTLTTSPCRGAGTPPHPGSWDPKVQARAGLVSLQASLLGVQTLSPPGVLTWASL